MTTDPIQPVPAPGSVGEAVERVQEAMPVHYFDCDKFNVNHSGQSSNCSCTAESDVDALLAAVDRLAATEDCELESVVETLHDALHDTACAVRRGFAPPPCPRRREAERLADALFTAKQGARLDVHPEDYCHRCHGPNRPWTAPSPLWNAVMRPDGPDAPWRWDEIICPTCFMVLANEAGIATHGWRLYTTADTGVSLVNSDGREWSWEKWLWVEPAGDAT